MYFEAPLTSFVSVGFVVRVIVNIQDERDFYLQSYKNEDSAATPVVEMSIEFELKTGEHRLPALLVNGLWI